MEIADSLHTIETLLEQIQFHITDEQPDVQPALIAELFSLIASDCPDESHISAKYGDTQWLADVLIQHFDQLKAKDAFRLVDLRHSQVKTGLEAWIVKQFADLLPEEVSLVLNAYPENKQYKELAL